MKNSKEIAEKYLLLFEKLLNEEDQEKQRQIAKDISEYSSKVNDLVQKNYSETLLQEIQESCLPMEHWKDETGYCNLNELDIKKYIGQLKEFI